MHTQVWPLVANLFSSYSSAILVFIFLIASQLGKLTPQLLSSTQSNISPLEPVHYSVYDIVALLLAGPMIVLSLNNNTDALFIFAVWDVV